MASEPPDGDAAAIEAEIRELEGRLKNAKQRLQHIQPQPSQLPPLPSPTHFLLLLADSALPLGSFAFSSGLESYLAHNNPRTASFAAFLPSSLSAIASTSLPYLLAAHRCPEELPLLDDWLDAATICTVARRASVAQGRALLGIWERSFRPNIGDDGVLRTFSATLRTSSTANSEDLPPVSAHLAPLLGVVSALVGLSLRQAAYVFLLGHAKALISAAVRASVFGPYQAQKVLSSGQLQSYIDTVIEREWAIPVEEAGQTVPVMDLWVGRHEVLYSRIFNS